MPVAFDSVCPDTSALSVASLTSGSWTIAGANLVVFGMIGTAAGSPTTHTEMRWRGSTGEVLTQIGATLTLANPADRFSAWRRIAPTAATDTAYGLWAASQDESCIGMVSYTGVDQTTPNAAAVTNTGSAASATGTATITVPSTAGDKILALVWTDCNTTGTTPVLAPGTSADGTPTERYFNNANMGGWHAAGIYEMTAVDSSTVINIDWSNGDAVNTYWGIIAFVVNAAAEGGIPALDEGGWDSTLNPPTDNVFVSLWRKALAAHKNRGLAAVGV